MAKTTITMPDEDFQKAKSYCKENDMKFSQLVRKTIKPIIENEEPGRID